MDINNVLNRFLRKEENNILITDENGDIIYKSAVMIIEPEQALEKIRLTDSEFDEQEFFDKKKNLYFNVKRAVIEEDGKKFICYQLIDESEYALLIKEVASYSKSISDMSKFQTSIMNQLSLSYDTFLPGLADYCGAGEVVMFIKQNGKVIKSSYIKELTRVTAGTPEQFTAFFSLKRGDEIDGYFCILNSTVQGHECVVLVKNAEPNGLTDPLDVSVHNIISLFIENSILRDKIVYESEHDKLTGLYNKGKYLAMKKISFGKPESIAIYNFDVNNLKHINDTYGHEYGDALIIKAAKSIAEVTSDNVFGFRMGGDEYVMVAVNVTAAEAEEIRDRWQAALNKLNKEDESLFCSMACGLVFGSGSYDYDELYTASDKGMYENKKALKANGITSRLVTADGS
jgi:diguanylate cyclase (GGDEF)-like protein